MLYLVCVQERILAHSGSIQWCLWLGRIRAINYLNSPCKEPKFLFRLSVLNAHTRVGRWGWESSKTNIHNLVWYIGMLAFLQCICFFSFRWSKYRWVLVHRIICESWEVEHEWCIKHKLLPEHLRCALCLQYSSCKYMNPEARRLFCHSSATSSWLCTNQTGFAG